MRSATPRVVLALTAVVVLALLAGEVTMQPSSRDRAVLIGVFAAVAVLVAIAAGLLGRWTARLSSLHTSVLVIAVGAVAAAAAAVLASAASMFISPHDLRLVLVALGLGVGLGVVLATAVSARLEEDLNAIGDAARSVAAGDRSVRTGVERADEVGAVAAALDDMIERLVAAENEQQRMQTARRDFLAAVSHDLRTPLTSLRAATEALEDGLVDDPSRYLAAMRTDLDLLTALVDDLFMLALIESGGLALVRERLDLAEVVDEAAEAVRPLANRGGIRLTAEIDGSVTVEAAPREISRILRNLLDNAVRHSPEGGTVRLMLSDEGGHATVTVTDEGPGFPADFVRRATESFTRADDARRRDGSGAGLGLAIARGLTEAHGGTIEVSAGPGGRVKVVFPVATQAAGVPS
jgi:signal transduction histidine kinase